MKKSVLLVNFLIFLLGFIVVSCDAPSQKEEQVKKELSAQDAKWLNYSPKVNLILDYMTDKADRYQTREVVREMLWDEYQFAPDSVMQFIISKMYVLWSADEATSIIYLRFFGEKISYPKLASFFPDHLDSIPNTVLKEMVLDERDSPMWMSHFWGVDSVWKYFQENPSHNPWVKIELITECLEYELACQEVAKLSDVIILRYSSTLYPFLPDERVEEIAKNIQEASIWEIWDFIQGSKLSMEKNREILNFRVKRIKSSELIETFFSPQYNKGEIFFTEQELIKILESRTNEALLDDPLYIKSYFTEFSFELSSQFPKLVIKSVRSTEDLQRALNFFKSNEEEFAEERGWWIKKLYDTKSHLL